MTDHNTPYQQTVDAIEHTLFTPDGNGKNRFEKELDSHVSRKLGRWMISGGIIIIVAGVGSYFSLDNRVSSVEDAQKAVDDRLATSLTEIKTEISSLRDLLIEVIRKNSGV